MHRVNTSNSESVTIHNKTLDGQVETTENLPFCTRNLKGMLGAGIYSSVTMRILHYSAHGKIARAGPTWEDEGFVWVRPPL